MPECAPDTHEYYVKECVRVCVHIQPYAIHCVTAAPADDDDVDDDDAAAVHAESAALS